MPFILHKLSFFFLIALALSAKAQKSDPRVTAALDSLGLKYSRSEAGDYKIVFSTSDKRSQLVIVNASTYIINEVEVREIVSAAYRLKNQKNLGSEELFHLLRENADNKIGQWQIDMIQDKYFLCFSMRIDADINAEKLGKLLELIAFEADKQEKLFTKDKDQF